MPSRDSPDEKVQMADIVEVKLTKADGTVITNEPKKITIEMLEDIINALHEVKEN